MICDGCGREISPQWRNCPVCGADIAMMGRNFRPSEQVVFRTTGGRSPKMNSATFNYVTAVMSFVVGTIAILFSSYGTREEMMIFMILGFVMLFFGIMEVIKIRVKSLADRRIITGELTISNRAVEGLAAQRKPNDVDVFVNPVMTRISLWDITSAGPDPEGVFLIVRAYGTEFVFATPDAIRAGAIIMDLIRTGGRVYG